MSAAWDETRKGEVRCGRGAEAQPHGERGHILLQARRRRDSSLPQLSCSAAQRHSHKRRQIFNLRLRAAHESPAVCRAAKAALSAMPSLWLKVVSLLSSCLPCLIPIACRPLPNVCTALKPAVCGKHTGTRKALARASRKNTKMQHQTSSVQSPNRPKNAKISL